METLGRRILVTGASGFIGTHVCRQLLTSGYQIRALVRGSQPFALSPNSTLETVTGDLENPESLYAACDAIDIVVHLAGISHANNISQKRLFDINAVGTESLLAAAISKNVKKFIFLSSSLAETISEDASPTTAYGASKLKAEELLLKAHNSGLINVLVLRPVNVYGAGMRGNISTLIKLISRSHIPRLPSLNTRISLVGINDVIQAIELSIKYSNMEYKVYTLTDGKVYKINDLEERIYQVLEKKMPAWRAPRFALYLILFFTGVVAKALNKIGLNLPSIAGISSRTYRNLVSDNLFDNSEACVELGFEPNETFYNSLPKWLRG